MVLKMALVLGCNLFTVTAVPIAGRRLQFLMDPAAPAPDSGGAWPPLPTAGSAVVLYAKGSFYGEVPAGTTFNAAVHAAGAGGLVRRECLNCAFGWKDIYYKRLTDLGTWDAQSLFLDTWSSVGNVLNTDFELYSSLADAQSGQNRWTFCNYDDVGIGFPRDCGPSGPRSRQWNSLTRGGQNDIQYSILEFTPGTTASTTAFSSTSSAATNTASTTATATSTSTSGAMLAADGAKVVWAHTTGVSGSGMQFDLPRPIAVEAPPGYTVHISSTYGGPDSIDTGLARIDDLEEYVRTLPHNSRGFGGLFWMSIPADPTLPGTPAFHIWDYWPASFYVHAQVTTTTTATTTTAPTTTTTTTYYDTMLAADGAEVVWAHTTGVSGSGMQFDLPRPIAVEAPPGHAVVISASRESGRSPDPIYTGLARIDDLEAYLRTLPDNAGRGFGDLMWIRQNGHVWDYHRRDFYVHAEDTTTTTGTTVTTISAADATGAAAAIGTIADALATLAQQIQLAVTNLENGVTGLA